MAAKAIKGTGSVRPLDLDAIEIHRIKEKQVR